MSALSFAPISHPARKNPYYYSANSHRHSEPKYLIQSRQTEASKKSYSVKKIHMVMAVKHLAFVDGNLALRRALILWRKLKDSSSRPNYTMLNHYLS
jgi:hypothetical protein